MGCTQASTANRVPIAPMGYDSDAAKQFQSEQDMQSREGQTAPSTGDSPSAKIIRQDWASLKQSLAPKNSIQLISCQDTMKPLLRKAVGEDAELEQNMLKLFKLQTQMPKQRILQETSSPTARDTDSMANTQDEVQFCMVMAKDQITVFKKKCKLSNLCYELASKFKELIRANPKLKVLAKQSKKSDKLPLQWIDDWYLRFSLVMMQMMASLGNFFKIISRNEELQEQAQKSQEVVTYYGCGLVLIRFLEGTSWGYSPMLMHQKLDKDITIALKVTFNLLLRLKQGYREDKQIGPAAQKRRDEDVQAIYCPEPLYQQIYSQNQLDKIICMKSSKDLDKTGENQEHFQLLENQVYRKTYITVKKEIDEFLRAPSYDKPSSKVQEESKEVMDTEEHDFLNQLQKANQSPGQDSEKTQTQLVPSFTSNVISVAQFKYQQSVKTLTRDFIKKLKNPDLCLDGTPKSLKKNGSMPRNLGTKHLNQADPIQMAKSHLNQKSSENMQKPKELADGKPTFSIDNSKNMMVLVGAQMDTRVIVETFLQANVRMRSKYKVVMMHCCTRENKLTHDSYYIVKNIISSIVRCVPAIGKYLMLQHHDYFAEILSTKGKLNKELKLQKEAPAILVKFCRVIKQLKLDFNICVFITGIENVFDMSDLQNIIYVLRSLACHSLHMPPFLRFVLTVESRESKSTQLEMILKLLQSQSTVQVRDQKFFEREGKVLAEFAFIYADHRQTSRKSVNRDNSMLTVEESNPGQTTASISQEDTQKLVQQILNVSQNSYRSIVDIIFHLYKSKVDLTNLQAAKTAISGYQSGHIMFLAQVNKLMKIDKTLIRTILQALTQICGPIGFELFAKLCYCLLFAKSFVKEERKASEKPKVAKGTRNDSAKLLDKQLTTMQEQKTQEDQEMLGASQGPTDKLADAVDSPSGQRNQNEKEEAKTMEPSARVLDDGGADYEDGDSEQRAYDDLKRKNNPKQKIDTVEEVKQATPERKDSKEVDHEFGDLSQYLSSSEETKSKKTNIEKVMQYVTRHLVAVETVPDEFKQSLAFNLLAISDNLFLISKEKLPAYRRRESQIFEQEDSNEDSDSEPDQTTETQSGPQTMKEVLWQAENLHRRGNFIQSQKILDDSVSKMLIVPRKRKMIKACMAVLGIRKSRYFDAVCQLVALVEFGGSNPLSKSMNLQWMPTTPYESIDPYLRQYIYHHWTKSQAKYRFTMWEPILTAENVFKQIVYLGSYERLRLNLGRILKRPNPDEKEVRGISFMTNTLHLIQQTLKYEPINFLDFCTQFRGRILGDAAAKNLPDMKFDELIKQSGKAEVCYFENFHHALRENPRIDLILSFPGCQILTLKFFSDKKRILISLSNGLILMFNTDTNQVLKVYVQVHAVVDKMKIIDDRYVVSAGIDSKHRIWNIDNQKQVSKFELHGYSTSHMVIHKESLYTYGYSKTLVKFNFMKKKYDSWIETSSYMTNLKLLKTSDKSAPVKLIASFADGDIVLYNMELDVLCNTNRSQQEPILRIICLSLQDCLCFYKDGQISVLSGMILEETKAGSIFSLKSDDYIDMILIKSREYFLFTIEKQKIEFFNASTFKRSDSWDYFFERDIVGCDKNKEGSKICIWDKGGYLTLFNFLKHLDNSKKEFNTPSHRRYDPVVCIDVTERLGSKNQVISCSLERDLRVWNRDTGLFLKKYDLSSFTAENVSTIKLGKSEGMLFLGSKDMNVYLIDVARGKLCVVYEGHWSRVTSIYTLPGKDILVTLSESNIKVWDLEYDECIKNMNDHSSLIVYCAISHHNDQLIVTISQSLEYKEWNYVTGTIVKQFTIDLAGIRDDNASQLDKSFGAEEESLTDSANSDDEMNPQFDDEQSTNKKMRMQPEIKPKNLVACHVSKEGFAYLAIDTNKIIVYDLNTKEVQSIFDSYQNQTVIYLMSIETERADYLVVVTRTSCILYSLHEDGVVRRMTGYLLNSRKKPFRSSEENMFSYSVRFYFTSAKIIKAQDDDGDEPTTSKGRPVAGVGLLGTQDVSAAQLDGASEVQDYLVGGFRTPELNVHGDENSMIDPGSLRQSIGSSNVHYMQMQQQAETYKNAIESLRESPLPAHNALAQQLQRNMSNSTSQVLMQQMEAASRVGGANASNGNAAFNEANYSSIDNFTQMYDIAPPYINSSSINVSQSNLRQPNHVGMMTQSTLQVHAENLAEPKQVKYLVYLGDQRGQVHMTSLYLY